MNNDPQVNRIKRVNFLITRLCNLHCRMCDYSINGLFYTSSISLGKILATIGELKELGVEVLELSGGEPMTRKDIFEIIDCAASSGLKIGMMTNGTLIGEPEAQRLIESGVTAVSVSLEGPEELNDRIRGAGNFKKVLSTIRYFEKYKKQKKAFTTVGIVLSKCNYKHILSFSKFLLEEIGVASVTINPFDKMMLYKNVREVRQKEFWVDPELIPDFSHELEGLIHYAEKMGERMPSPQFLQQIPDYFLGKRIAPKGGCVVPVTTCAINIDGYVYPCWKAPNAGNLHELSLKEILGSNAYLDYAEQAFQGQCAGCLFACYAKAY